MKKRLLLLLTIIFSFLSYLAPTNTFCSGGEETLAIDGFSVLAIDSLLIKAGATINSGNVAVINSGCSPCLKKDFEAKLGKDSYLADGVCLYADTVKLKKGSSVHTVYYNEIFGKGTIRGAENGQIAVPLNVAIPDFPTTEIADNNILIPKNETQTVDPGVYGTVKVKKNSTLILSGGVYYFGGLELKKNANLIAQGPSEIIIKENLNTNQYVYIGPDEGAGFGANQLTLYASGATAIDDENSPKAVKIGSNSIIKANLYAPNGTIHIKSGSNLEGAAIGKYVIIGKNTELALNSAFVSASPTSGVGAVSVGDLALTNFTEDNVFSYEVIEGDFLGAQNSFQMESFDSEFDTDGHIWFGEDGNEYPRGIALSMKFSSDLLISLVDDYNFQDVTTIITKEGLDIENVELDGKYNGFGLGNGMTFGSYQISNNGSLLTLTIPSGSSEYIFNSDLSISPTNSNVLRGEVREDADEINDFNIICDGNSMIVDLPPSSFLGQGFGFGIKASELSVNEFVPGKTFFIIGYNIGRGSFNVSGDVVSYSVLYVNNSMEEGVLELNPEKCAERTLPNNGLGWACSDSGKTFLIDPTQGIFAVSDQSGNALGFGGW